MTLLSPDALELIAVYIDASAACPPSSDAADADSEPHLPDDVASLAATCRCIRDVLLRYAQRGGCSLGYLISTSRYFMALHHPMASKRSWSRRDHMRVPPNAPAARVYAVGTPELLALNDARSFAFVCHATAVRLQLSEMKTIRCGGGWDGRSLCILRQTAAGRIECRPVESDVETLDALWRETMSHSDQRVRPRSAVSPRDTADALLCRTMDRMVGETVGEWQYLFNWLLHGPRYQLGTDRRGRPVACGVIVAVELLIGSARLRESVARAIASPSNCDPGVNDLLRLLMRRAIGRDAGSRRALPLAALISFMSSTGTLDRFMMVAASVIFEQAAATDFELPAEALTAELHAMADLTRAIREQLGSTGESMVVGEMLSADPTARYHPTIVRWTVIPEDVRHRADYSDEPLAALGESEADGPSEHAAPGSAPPGLRRHHRYIRLDARAVEFIRMTFGAA